MKKVLFIDQDGTIIIEPEDEKLDSIQKLEFLPGAISYLSRIANEMDYELVIVTNQDGLGTAALPDETFFPAHNKMLSILKNEGITFREVCIDRTYPEDKAPTRKPEIGMVKHYLNGEFDIKNSFMVGDRFTDALLAKNLGCKAIHIQAVLSKNHQHMWKEDEVVVLHASDWKEIYHFLKQHGRRTIVERKTSETAIRIELNLEGIGNASIDTGINFFNHMLEQLSKHGGVDLLVQVNGDLQIDEHHTIEDTALALGAAFIKALGNKKGIGRYGFVLPMDDSLAQVAIDFGGRPWLEWDVEFKREKIGDMPTEMFKHFFKSFSDTAKCNLNIKAEGENEHHKIEAIFKGFAKAIKMAVKQEENMTIPSTKGVL